MRVNDALIGGILMLFAVAIMAYAQTLPSRPGVDFGPGLFPTIIGAGLFSSGALLTWQGFRRREAAVHVPAWVRSPRHVGGVALLFGLIVFYVVLADDLGFLLTAFFILAAFQSWFGVRIGAALIVAALGAVGLYVAFSRFLAVPLPVAWLETLFW